MNLEGILKNIKFTLLKGNTDINANNIQYDSRKLSQGDIFVCIKGFATDGHKYISQAIEKGARVIVIEDDVEINEDVVVIKVDDTRKALALMAANYYDNPSKKMKIIGVTGTNGKTTSTYMIKDILEKANKKVGLIGTISNYICGETIHAERTTPESLELQELFSKMVDKGVEYCIMEVSSHSLELDRVYGVEYEAGIFTNLTRDHLDFHKTFENYFMAKYKMFERSKNVIVNLDDKYGKDVARLIEERGDKNLLTFSQEGDSDFKPYDVKFGSKEIVFKLLIDDKEEEFTISIPGHYNLYNGLGAIIATKILGIDIKNIKEGLKGAVVPGRCERAASSYNLPYEIIIDYAHSPDGLENILSTARGFTEGRLISVFGCGGDRDKVKRPQMGKIGSNLSDIAIITSDNPRSEEPMAIIDDIIAGIDKENYLKIEKRQDAIKEAINIAKPGDVIVIAGKGHETYQIFKDKTIHFDEREVINEILDNRGE